MGFYMAYLGFCVARLGKNNDHVNVEFSQLTRN